MITRSEVARSEVFIIFNFSEWHLLHWIRATQDGAMANLTITVDEDLLKKARIRALEQGTSVNAVLREYLESYTGMRSSREVTVAEIINLSRKSRSRRGSKRWTRDDLHDRSR